MSEAAKTASGKEAAKAAKAKARDDKRAKHRAAREDDAAKFGHQFTFRVNTEVAQRLAEEANKDKRSVGHLVRGIIDKHLGIK